ncbi:transposable element Tcb1 transposase [Trichonephila clavipes]|nr:transposable element Tcb1 transposase [Trichonephila clavipes]
MVWGVISYHGRSNLLRIEGNLNSNRYVREVVQPEVVPLLQGVTGAIFQQIIPVHMFQKLFETSVQPNTCRVFLGLLIRGICHVRHLVGWSCTRDPRPAASKDELLLRIVSSPRLWQRFQGDGNVSRCYSTGRPLVTTPNEDQYLAVIAKRNRRSTASDLFRQLSSATGTTVSRQTVYRCLGHIGLYARRPVRCVPLTATHCRLRLTWSREHALWTPQQWSCVIFSDESRFSLQSDSRRTLIWRAPGTRYHQENTIERHRYGGGR